MDNKSLPRVAILQRVCKSYRLELFRGLNENPALITRLFIGEDVPGGKSRSAQDLSGIDVQRLRSKNVRVGGRVLTWHKGLLRAIEEFQPDVIVSEGESHVLGYLQAIRYRRKNPSAKLIHWGGGGLPGNENRLGGLRTRLISQLHKRFDAFMVYSTFARDWLVDTGIPAEKIQVAVNVGNTGYHSELTKDGPVGKKAARESLGLPERFTVLYAGTMSENKRPGLLLDLANLPGAPNVNYVLIGDGPALSNLRDRVSTEMLENVYVRGNAGKDLATYYRAADVLIIPGRGGIVISEAMTWSLPVVTHQADGTEVDLIENGESGYLLSDGSAASFKQAIEKLIKRPDLAQQMGNRGKELVDQRFGNNYMQRTVADYILAVADQKVGVN